MLTLFQLLHQLGFIDMVQLFGVDSGALEGLQRAGTVKVICVRILGWSFCEIYVLK